MYTRIVKSAAIILGVAMIATSLMLMAAPGYTFASNITLVGNDSGLTLDSTGPLFTENNMAPGDETISTVTVRNTTSNPLPFYVTVEKESGDDIMYESLVVTVTGLGEDSTGSETKYMNQVSGLPLGNIPIGGAKEIGFMVTMSPNAGNDLQGKTLSVTWVFTAQFQESETDDGPDDEDENNEDDIVLDNQTPAGPVIPPVPQPPVVTDPGEDDEVIVIIEDDPIPQGPPVLPKTGETNPALFLGAGALLVAFGIIVGRKRKPA